MHPSETNEEPRYLDFSRHAGETSRTLQKRAAWFSVLPSGTKSSVNLSCGDCLIRRSGIYPIPGTALVSGFDEDKAFNLIVAKNFAFLISATQDCNIAVM
jgi:hypothetical protein